ncbi:MAG TPA: redoxin family protein [Pyrinomonadaceae bacterium]|nr:redoxin family protein [Pyrinomonadaceae bacterium]
MSKRWIPIVGVVLFFLVVFCAGFAFFYSRMARSEAEVSAGKERSDEEVSAAPKSLINTPLPSSQLVDVDGSKVDEQILRRGRVIIVFVTLECDACLTESKFLETILSRRKDVTFYGLVPFGRPPSPHEAADKFPFKVFYDESGSFLARMGINRVPVKVFLEDGIIKKGWIGAAQTDKSRTSFIEWLDNLP